MIQFWEYFPDGLGKQPPTSLPASLLLFGSRFFFQHQPFKGAVFHLMDSFLYLFLADFFSKKGT